MLSRIAAKPIRSQTLKVSRTSSDARPVITIHAARLMQFQKTYLSTSPMPQQGVEQPWKDKALHALKTNEAPSSFVRMTAAPGYDIMESPSHLRVTMVIPHDSNLTVEIEPGSKAMCIVGDAHGTRFVKRFTAGSALDSNRLLANVVDGHFVVQAPKIQSCAHH